MEESIVKLDEKLTGKQYSFVCEILWGGVPVDKNWAQGTKFFKESSIKILEQFPKLDRSSFAIWSVFENEHMVEKEWKKELNFYSGVFSFGKLKEEYDDETDWRFCEVKGKRKRLKFLGVTYAEFPIKFPIPLLDGKMVEKPTK